MHWMPFACGKICVESFNWQLCMSPGIRQCVWVLKARRKYYCLSRKDSFHVTVRILLLCEMAGVSLFSFKEQQNYWRNLPSNLCLVWSWFTTWGQGLIALVVVEADCKMYLLVIMLVHSALLWQQDTVSRCGLSSGWWSQCWQMHWASENQTDMNHWLGHSQGSSNTMVFNFFWWTPQTFNNEVCSQLLLYIRMIPEGSDTAFCC